jgi:hypothetical protein
MVELFIHDGVRQGEQFEIILQGTAASKPSEKR